MNNDEISNEIATSIILSINEIIRERDCGHDAFSLTVGGFSKALLALEEASPNFLKAVRSRLAEQLS